MIIFMELQKISYGISQNHHDLLNSLNHLWNSISTIHLWNSINDSRIEFHKCLHLWNSINDFGNSIDHLWNWKNIYGIPKMFTLVHFG